MLLLFLTSTPKLGWCQASQKPPRKPATQPYDGTDFPAVMELRKRLDAAHAARDSGNPEGIAAANRRLIALSLREIAHLRLLENALAPAVELYRRSLDFEDIPATRVDLAVAYVLAKKPDDSLTAAGSAILADPANSRAWHIQGKAWMMKKDYVHAADSLARSLALQRDGEAAYSLGVCWLRIHEKEKAAIVFKQMEEGAVDLGTLHVLLARAYRDADYLPDAVRELKLAIEINPQTPHAHYLLGLVYLLQEEWAPNAEIRNQFLTELKLNSRDFLSNYLLGALGSNEKKYEESDRYLKIAIDIDPTWPEPWLYMGLNANSQGNYGKAEEYLRKSITLTGKDDARSNYFIRKAYFALGRILSQSGKKEEAQAMLHQARDLQQRVQLQSLQDSPVNQFANKAGDAYVPANPDAEDAPAPELESVDSTAQLEVAVLARANLSDAEKREALAQEKNLRSILGASLNDLATSEAIRQQYDLALDHYQEAERWNPEFPGLMRNLGVTALRAKKYPEAVRALSQTVTANPDDRAARAMLGMSYYMTDQYKDAARTISPLGEAAIKDHGLAYSWADSLAKQGKFKEASAILDKLDTQPLQPDTRMLVARSWDEVGNHLRAVETFHQILQQDPARPQAHYYAGVAYIHAARPADAAAEFKAELALNPDDADARYNLGFVYLQLSQSDEAIAQFRSVISAHPEHASAQYQLGKFLMDTGNLKEAISHLEAATHLSPQTDYMHYQLQAAYRKDSRIQDADRELQLYKEIKGRNRERTVPQPDPDAQPNQ